MAEASINTEAIPSNKEFTHPPERRAETAKKAIDEFRAAVETFRSNLQGTTPERFLKGSRGLNQAVAESLAGLSKKDRELIESSETHHQAFRRLVTEMISIV